ncbi:MAG: lysylphosphatidylglycerol synthase domain-containing protein [Actinomycetota bacterium]|nr:lysylphosphatidylglycerol synthase domain-containing protein [Actinomycetota bacterium]
MSTHQALPATKRVEPRLRTRSADGLGSPSAAETGFVRHPLTAIAVSAAPIVLEGRYRVLVTALWRLRRSRKGRWGLAVASGGVMIALALLTARHFATTSWPLSKGQPGVIVAAGLLLLLAQAFKAYGWGRLFAPAERPNALSLAAGNGGAALIGVVLPGRFDDAMRVAVVRRYPGCPAGVRTLCLSLVMLGLIDSVALAPLAFVAALFPGAGMGVRAGLAVVAAAGVAAAALILALPRLAASERALRFRIGRWVSPRTTSRRRALEAWALVSACWLLRAVAFFLLLGTLGVGYSFPLTLLFLCAGAAGAAVPIGPAGAATQVGAGAATLIASGVGGSEALAVAVAVGALGVLSGTAVLLGAIVWRTLVTVAEARPGLWGRAKAQA